MHVYSFDISSFKGIPFFSNSAYDILLLLLFLDAWPSANWRWNLNEYQGWRTHQSDQSGNRATHSQTLPKLTLPPATSPFKLKNTLLSSHPLSLLSPPPSPPFPFHPFGSSTVISTPQSRSWLMGFILYTTYTHTNTSSHANKLYPYKTRNTSSIWVLHLQKKNHPFQNLKYKWEPFCKLWNTKRWRKEGGWLSRCLIIYKYSHLIPCPLIVLITTNNKISIPTNLVSYNFNLFI